MIPDDDEQEFITALAEAIGHTGATGLQIGYLDEIEPVAWVAMASYEGDRHKTGSGLSLTAALTNLYENLVDGGKCQHCGKVTSFLHAQEINEHPLSVALSTATCVYSYRDGKIRPGCQP